MDVPKIWSTAFYAGYHVKLDEINGVRSIGQCSYLFEEYMLEHHQAWIRHSFHPLTKARTPNYMEENEFNELYDNGEL